MAWHDVGLMGRPSQRAPPPRLASKRTPLAWLATTAARGPLASMAQALVAHHGRPR